MGKMELGIFPLGISPEIPLGISRDFPRNSSRSPEIFLVFSESLEVLPVIPSGIASESPAGIPPGLQKFLLEVTLRFLSEARLIPSRILSRLPREFLQRFLQDFFHGFINSFFRDSIG